MCIRLVRSLRDTLLPKRCAGMFSLGITTVEQYVRAARKGPLSGTTTSYGLLQIGENPTTEEVSRFEDINLVVRTSNGTRRTTFRHRMLDVDATTLELLQKWYPQDAELLVQDRAASNCLTSAEWAQRLFQAFPRATFEASDRLLYLLRICLEGGKAYIIEPDGEPLQYLTPLFVLFLSYREPYRYPLRSLMAARAKRSFRRLGLPQRNSTYRLEQISCIHPEAKSLCNKDSRFQICIRSVFGRSPAVHVLRTMNILNKNYFRDEKLVEGANAAFQTLKPGGLWIVGRTLKNLTNHVTFFRRTENKWEVIARIGKGSEIEELIA
ncbi:MAG TPA: hypothetical protein VFF50_05935 [Candidatus Deferrimicrobiaceae bacterium]|nr:hypothetical protein [Candidatus Deferrimicrobiaceae bacterium]